MWVVGTIMVPFWIPTIIRHLIFRVPKRDHNFDNHLYVSGHSPHAMFRFSPGLLPGFVEERPTEYRTVASERSPDYKCKLQHLADMNSRISPRDPSKQKMRALPSLGPKVYYYYLHWAI